MIKRRTPTEMKMDILDEISKNEHELKRTHIGSKAEINYMTSVKLTDEMAREKLIKRDNKGFYSTTELGRDTLLIYKTERETINEVMKLAREIAETPIKEQIKDEQRMRLRHLLKIGD